MAIMRKEQKDIDGLGPIGIIREALKVFWAHAKVFTLIQIALMLVLAIFAVVGQYFIFKSLPQPDHHNPFTGTWVSHLAGHFKSSSLEGFAGLDFNFIILFLVAGAGGVVFQAALSLSIAASLYALGLHYTGQAVSFVDVVRTSTCRLWMRLALTNTYFFLLSFSISSVQFVGTILLIQYEAPQLWLTLGTAGLALLSLVGAVWLSIVFTVAAGVSVLEDDYGWAAVNKSFKLLKGKEKIAIVFQLLWVVPGLVQGGLQSLLRSLIVKDDSSAVTLTLLLLGLVAYVGWMTFIWQLHALCSGVQYVSFKAYHDESLADSLYKKPTTKGGGEINESLLGGRQTDSTV